MFVDGHQMIETCWRRNKQPLLLCSDGYCVSMENELVFAVANVFLTLLVSTNNQYIFHFQFCIRHWPLLYATADGQGLTIV